MRAAASYYQAALKAAQRGGAIDPALHSRLTAAAGYIRQAAEAYKASLRAVVAGRPSVPGRTDRLRHALEILNGEREMFLQRPSVLYYPYLAKRQFFERDEFDWVPALEAATPAIRDELLALVNEGADFRPYVQDDPARPKRDFHGLNNNPTGPRSICGGRQACRRERTPLPADGGSAEQSADVEHRRADPRRAVLETRPGSAHSAAQRDAQLPSDLPPAADRSRRLLAARRQRDPPVAGRQVADLRRQHRARSEESERRNPDHPAVRLWRPELSEAERDGISAIFDTIDRFTGVVAEA